MIKNICCIGAGYVGGPTMGVIAYNCPNLNINVVDINESRIEKWNSDNLDELPIYEPGLDQIIRKCRGVNLHFSTDLKENISIADMIFISVNTPTKNRGIGAGKASDLRWIESSARDIAKYAKGRTIVVEKSTLPVKTAETIKKILYSSKNNQKNCDFEILSNPEFLAEGSAINDLQNPDRVLIGGEDSKAIEELSNIYLHWVDSEKIIKTNLWSSELSKLVANAFLAQRVSSINSITAICEVTGANIKEVTKAIGADSRIGDKFLNAGPGFGGSCFKKDILNLIYLSNHYGLYEVSKYWEQVLNINEWQNERIPEIITKNLFGTLAEKKIAVLGFAFKSNTNDTRESPAIGICKKLIEEGSNLKIYDPKVQEKQICIDLNLEQNHHNVHNDLGSWEKVSTISESVNDADALLIITEWEEFKDLNFKKLISSMRHPSWIFDTRGIIKKESALKAGFNVWMIGNGGGF